MDRGAMPCYVWLVLLVVMPALVLAGAFKHVGHEQWTSKYDRHFKKYAKRYFGAGFDWRWFKAQGIAESNLKADAKSAAGAKGLMQIMPATFAEIQKKNPNFQHIDSPRWNIAASIYYNRQLYRRCEKNIVVKDCLPFTFASYNAGFGNVRKAYRKAEAQGEGVRRWSHVEPHVPGQTRHYVRRIYQLMQKKPS
jgi:soluble lytic murein transglycosylase-like protein